MSMGIQKVDQISKEARVLVSCVTGILDDHKVKYELMEVDLSHAESIWYQIAVETSPESMLKFVLHLFRDAIGLFCNDYQVSIYLSEKPSDFETWIEYLPQIITAIFRPELRIRARHSLLSGKNAAIWLELPEGGKWMGDKKACKGSGKEYIFRNWF